ncbi:single-strand binding protein family-domain-containing protein [Lentinula aff. detonsa]|uniref:Single-strand binding protein family-domain-containing protein n=1 Tax=Lentinula aff. detonsa TaxID=2804958 RepID=A0AA38NTA0_9AGAR|nr:single-strand binding protein family-domain-containing protein [Lentinula aff. detonsa]KAJ3797508.1 single-strand binding protein family-domain-containing protein [Lentinula aff. detonsa]
MFATIRSAAFTRSAARTFSTSASRADVAKLTLVGRLGRDPEVKQTKNDNEYVTYVVATSTFNPGPADANGERPPPRTSWHRVLSFQESSNRYLQTLKKGTLVYVEAGYELREPEPDADPTTPAGQRQIFLRHETIRVLSHPKSTEQEET